MENLSVRPRMFLTLFRMSVKRSPSPPNMILWKVSQIRNCKREDLTSQGSFVPSHLSYRCLWPSARWCSWSSSDPEDAFPDSRMERKGGNLFLISVWKQRCTGGEGLRKLSSSGFLNFYLPPPLLPLPPPLFCFSLLSSPSSSVSVFFCFLLWIKFCQIPFWCKLSDCLDLSSQGTALRPK